MSLSQLKLQVLTILSDNLKEPHPDLVTTATVAGRMNVRMAELRLLLQSMDGAGLIQTDTNQQYNLITQKGLQYLESQRGDV